MLLSACATATEHIDHAAEEHRFSERVLIVTATLASAVKPAQTCCRGQVLQERGRRPAENPWKDFSRALFAFAGGLTGGVAVDGGCGAAGGAVHAL